MLKISKYKLTLRKLLASVLLLVSHILVSQAAYYMSIPRIGEGIYVGMRHIILTALISGLFYFMFVRSQMIYNSHLREKYSANIKCNRTKFVLLSCDYWFDIVGFIVVVFAFDINKTYSIFSDYFSNSLNDKIILIGSTVPILMFLNYIARQTAISSWLHMSEEKALTYIQNPDLTGDPMSKPASILVPTVPEFSAMRFLSRTYSKNATSNPNVEHMEIDEAAFTTKAKVKSFFYDWVVAILLILSGKFLYKITATVLLPFAKMIITWQSLTIVATIIVALICFKRIRALLNRRNFIKRLRKICSGNGYELSGENALYSSLFALKNGESFCVSINGENYSCKLVSCIKSSVPLIFDEEGSVMFLHAITFAGVKWFERTSKWKYDYESNNKKILILNPSSKFTYSIADGKIGEVDNGDCIGEYKVFTGNSFINAIERNCLDK